MFLLDYWSWLHSVLQQLECLYTPLLSYIAGPLLETVTLKERRFRLLRELGQGGYAFVYLAQEVPSGNNVHHIVDSDARFALKKVLASTPERLEAAQREAYIQSQARHPCILPLLDWAVIPPSPANPDAGHTVYFLSPAYPDGTLADELARLSQHPASQPPNKQQGCALSTAQVLGIFQQLCLALDALHGAGYAHRDVKTHNLLIHRPTSVNQTQQPHLALDMSAAQAAVSQPVARHGPSSLSRTSAPLSAPQPPATPAQTRPTQQAAGATWSQPTTPTSTQTGHTFTLPMRSSVHSSDVTDTPIDAKDVLAEGITTRVSGCSTPTHAAEGADPGQALLSAHRAGDGGGGAGGAGTYRAVLMDFGSAGPRYMEVRTRSEALLLQEDAEANCTATFRAPELWDVPSPTTLDQGAVDVWAAGCTLYAAMYGQSPFQISLNQGGSLALAVLNNNIPWPTDPRATYPAPLHDLVKQCLRSDPSQRPQPAELAAQAAALLAAHPPLPDPPLYTRC